jgi:DNA replication and repair protein RecF
LLIRVLGTRSFRNLEPATIAFSAGVNLIVGPNGAGKTSALEALAVLANLRSFRASSWRSVMRHGSREFALWGEVDGSRGGGRLQLAVDAGPPVQRSVALDGAAVSVDQYLTVCPVFALTSADSDLVVGPPALRRALLDRLAFLLDPGTLTDVRGLYRALKQRNAALTGGAEDRELDAWDQRLAALSAAVVDRRRRAVSRLEASFAKTYRVLRGDGFPEMAVSYRAESWLNGCEPPAELEESYRKRYNQTRRRDRHTGQTLDGPHRHDLRLEADGRTAREVLSSGQTKIVAAALRLATVVQVEGDRGESLPVIIDDVDAELDSAVFARLTRALAGERQLFVSSAHGELVATSFPEARIVAMESGCARIAG